MNKKTKLFETGPERYQPDPDFQIQNHYDYTLNQRRLAAMVGLAALGLPVFLLIGTAFGTCFYDSISHFYYAQFHGGVFIAVLVFIATFLIVYRGESKSESFLAKIAGVCALGVALFPTQGSGCTNSGFSGRALVDFSYMAESKVIAISGPSNFENYFNLFEKAGILHFGSAALLFSFLAYYSFFVFTRTIAPDHFLADGQLKRTKVLRNRIYNVSGFAILAAMGAMFGNFVYEMVSQSEWQVWYDYNLTFWFEALALWAFGISWMVKGRFFGTLLID